MTLDLDALRPWSVLRVANALDLHPFEVIRILATDGSLPRDLRLRPQDVARVVEAGGLEAWWDPAEASERTTALLVRALARELLARGVVEPTWTRADNLFRGLEPAEQGVVRRAVNAWIRRGAMGSRMSPRGMELTTRASAVGDFAALAESGTGAYCGLLEDG
ncbi:MAG: hypothetical protein Q8P41_24035 [Pseudomonadota bacterium]|nr:hypothetical protein [Pseudomonadota bacterium]